MRDGGRLPAKSPILLIFSKLLISETRINLFRVYAPFRYFIATPDKTEKSEPEPPIVEERQKIELIGQKGECDDM